MKYTDYLGNPIAAGDTVVYPRCSGSSAATLSQGVVVELLPIVPEKVSDPEGRLGSTYEDIRRGEFAARRMIGSYDPTTKKWLRDDSKAYMLRVALIRSPSVWNKSAGPRTTTVKNVDRVLVVTRLLVSE